MSRRRFSIKGDFDICPNCGQARRILWGAMTRGGGMKQAIKKEKIAWQCQCGSKKIIEPEELPTLRERFETLIPKAPTETRPLF